MLLVQQKHTEHAQEIYAHDSELLVWWGTAIECESALSRLEREALLTPDLSDRARERLSYLSTAWHEVQPSERVRSTALRLLRVHKLRAADALQLAAAIQSSMDSPASLGFFSFDDHLNTAARKEGFKMVSSQKGHCVAKKDTA
jgi:predicted nucleic acid-binding protein